jgi:multicomponent Na+:H+ antiporter subunit E
MIRSIFLRGLLFVVLWWILAEGRHDGWLLGGVAVAAATWTSIKLQPPGTQPMRLAGLVGFLRFFLWHSLRGGMWPRWPCAGARPCGPGSSNCG